MAVIDAEHLHKQYGEKIAVDDVSLTVDEGETGIGVIERLREALGASGPAFLISGDTAPERLREASAGGYHLLQKPVSPMTLRTTLNRLFKSYEAREPSPHASVG